MKPQKPTRPPGRPTPLAAAKYRIAVLEWELERARAIRAAGRVDPRAVFEEIAGDRTAPPMARVSAARSLARMDAGGPDDDEDGLDDLTRRALAMGDRNG